LAMMPVEVPATCDKPKLALVGSADAYCPRATFQSWFERLGEPRESLTLPGADHFLMGREAEVARAVAGFLARQGLSPSCGDGGPS